MVHAAKTLWECAHTENVHVGIGVLVFEQNTREMESDQTDRKMGDGKLTEFLPEVDNDTDENSDDCDHGELPLHISVTVHRVSISSSCSSPKRLRFSTVKKKLWF